MISRWRTAPIRKHGLEADVKTYMITAAAAALFSVFGFILFRGIHSAADGPEFGNAAVFPEKGGEMRWLVLGMTVCNEAIALFLPWFYGITAMDTMKAVAFCTMLWPCAWVDWKLHLIPNRLLLMGLVARFLLFAVEFMISVQEACYIAIGSIIAAFGSAIACLLCRLAVPHSVGYGDVKLLAVMGLYLGMDYAWNGILLSLILLFFAAVFLLLTKRAERGTEMPFAPFLLIGTILAAFLTGI